MRTPKRSPKHSPWIRQLGLVLTALLVVGNAAHAVEKAKVKGQTEAAAADSDIERRLQELEQSQKRVKELEETVNRLNRDQRAVEVTLESQKPIAGWLNNGFSVNSADGAYKLKLAAYTQADGRFFISDSEDRSTSQFLFRRARLDVQGTVAKYFDFRIMPDFAGASFTLFDAYVETNYVPWAKVRVGKFKPPVGLERLQSATAITFIERGLPTNLVPSRDNGVQLGGDLLSGTVNYAVGIFNGVPDGGNSPGDVNDDKEFAGRIFVHPFKELDFVEALRGLGVGVAGTYGRVRGTPSSTELSSIRTTGQAAFFSYRTGTPADANNTAIGRGDHTRITPQFYYYFQSLGLLGEWVSSNQEVQRGNRAGNINNEAWQIAGSYVLTGELASFKGVNPTSPFNPFDGTWGAFEVAARVGQVNIDREAFDKNFADPKRSARRATEWVLGLNWYLNRHVKFALNYTNTNFNSGGAVGNRKAEDAILSRVQLAF